MNKHSHRFIELSILIIWMLVLLTLIGYEPIGKHDPRWLVEQQTLCADTKGIIYSRYEIYVIQSEYTRFMTDKEYQEYCTPHAGSVERKPK